MHADPISSGINRYQAIFEHSLHAIFIKRQDGSIVESNAAASRMFGYAPGEFLSLPIQGLLIYPQGVKAADIEGKGTPVAITAIGRNGQRFACWYSSVYFHDENGEALVSCMLADITGSWQNSGQLLREKELSDTIINSLPGVFYLFNAEGRFIRWNHNLETVTGYSAEEIANIHPLDFFDEDEKPLIADRITEVFARGRSDVEASFLTRDGRKVPHYFNGMAIEFENQACLIGMGIDISLRVTAEQAIRESNDRYNMVAMATNDNIWDWDLVTNKVIRNGNKLEEQYGYGPWDPAEVDHYWNRMTHPADWQKVCIKRQAIFDDPSCNYWEDEYRFLKKDGTYAYVYDRGYILRDTNGKAVRMIGASQDITQRKIHEEELTAKNNELKRLSAHLQQVREEERKYMAREVHDELGQLASAIKIDINWLSLRIPVMDDMIRSRIEHATKTVEVLIDAVRRMAYSLRPSILDDFGLNEALKWYCIDFQNLNGVACVFTAGADDSWLDMHTKTELFRIAQESLTNVMRHAKAATVAVGTTVSNNLFCLSVSDDGIGFDTGIQKNTLGLVGLRERVMSIHGKLTINSVAGQGTTIAVMIPVSNVSGSTGGTDNTFKPGRHEDINRG